MDRDRTLELKVGVFVAIGLAMIAAFVVKFGRLGEGFKTYYDLTVRFKDASGLLKGSDVLLSGARIGRVGGGPRLLREGEGGGPAAHLRLRQNSERQQVYSGKFRIAGRPICEC